LAWIQKILVNECLGRIRRKKARPETSIEDLLPEFRDDGHRANPLPPWPDSSNSAMQRERRCELVTKHLQKLPQSLRSIILLRDIEGYSGQETAEALDISVGAVKVRLHRARQALRQLLEPTMVGESNDL
jgi:RNA polymerase sigma-70 factor (ECF subfamily)